MLKPLKDHMVEVATHSSGFMVLVRALDVTDDTVRHPHTQHALHAVAHAVVRCHQKMLIKTVLAEMTPMLDVLVHDLYGHKVLLHIVRPGDTKYFHPMGKASPTEKTAMRGVSADNSCTCPKPFDY